MFFGKILKFVVVKIASVSDDSEYNDLPIIEAGASDVASGLRVQVLCNETTDLVSEFLLSKEVTQRSQDWYNLISTIEIELQIINGTTAKTLLSLKALSHPYCSLKIFA